MTTLLLALLLLQVPTAMQGVPGTELIDFSKVGHDSAEIYLTPLRDITKLKKVVTTSMKPGSSRPYMMTTATIRSPILPSEG